MSYDKYAQPLWARQAGCSQGSTVPFGRRRDVASSEYSNSREMMETILYGSGDGDLDEVREIVEARLGVRLEPRESSYKGGDYFGADLAGGEVVTVMDNRVPDEDGEVLRPDHASYRTLVVLDETDRGDELVAALSGESRLRMLEREQW
ncbi:hypothetical protein [Amycolatopsis sp. 195334CR]|uniref:hypothetical protein n=1 Tax=Amycolatopsis sp. 195334CR TaxID=2814588 RepID=UPI001A8C0A94|nr:hypothetical protein [Amycolatopsis sp. 195334CR]MBN6034097.1 hypothetical protein [Amycolatopsis sp. 195334CR]